MPSVEVSIPDHVDSEINRLVERGDFINREQAIEQLLSMGLSAQGTGEDSDQEVGEDMFTQAVDDQQDPAIRDDTGDDDYVF
ncbi:MAG: CopG family transcriptional regulator [Halobacteriales archaeon]|nr:CopG family transcriptional regulator [Halobacteriales archaeon]